MATDSSTSKAHTCKCLNVWIEPQPSPLSQSPQLVPDPDFAPVFIGEHGITVSHPQVTLRTRSRGTQISGTTQCTRYTSLTCLVCQTLVYRVHQIVPLDTEGKEGPQLPTDEWVEQEIMKSSSGWIEVHNDCLTNNAIPEAQASSSFSDTFNLVLHFDPLPTSPSTLPVVGSPLRPQSPPFRLSTPPIPSPTSPSTSLPPQPFLSDLRPLFPPVPFTPSHPAFLHFADIASERSKRLREAAEQDLAKIVADKRAHVEQIEDALRREVEAIWRNFRQGIDKAKKDGSPSAGQRSSREYDKSSSVDRASSPGSHKNPVAIRDFVPVITRSVKTRPIAHTPRMSSLSASMATSSFHHPMAQQDHDRSTADVNLGQDLHQEVSSSDSSSLGSSASRTLSTQSTGSSKSVPLRIKSESGGVLSEPFKRSMDPVRDTAASYRYFTILEADAARARDREKETDRECNVHESSISGIVNRGRSEVAKTVTNGSSGQVSQQAVSKHEVAATAATDGAEASREAVKGKRKVTFVVVKSDVNTTQNEQKEVVVSKGQEDGVTVTAENADLIFDIDDEGSERSVSDLPTRPVVLPLLTDSPPLRPTRPRPNKAPSHAGLPESLIALRPLSLPLPSNIRPPRSHQGADASGPTGQADHAVPIQPLGESRKKRKPGRPIENDEPLTIGEAELMKLVAASTPSHRGAWNRDSKAWQLFVRRQDDRSHSVNIIPEETEDSEDLVGNKSTHNHHGESDSGDNNIHRGPPIAGSLPIAIGALSRPREALNLASYQPQALITSSDLPDSSQTKSRVTGRTNPSSSALRKAAYAERDRTRFMDPGVLDFATEEDEEEEIDGSDNELLTAGPPSAGELGRKRALKILEVRAKLPEEGMWRSLA